MMPAKVAMRNNLKSNFAKNTGRMPGEHKAPQHNAADENREEEKWQRQMFRVPKCQPRIARQRGTGGGEQRPVQCARLKEVAHEIKKFRQPSRAPVGGESAASLQFCKGHIDEQVGGNLFQFLFERGEVAMFGQMQPRSSLE
jgi:hypothetical protein